MSNPLLADAGAKGRGLYELQSIGLQIPPTAVLAHVDEITDYLETPSSWDSVSRWIIRPSAIVPEEESPLLSGLFPSHVVSAPQKVKSVSTCLKNDLRSDVDTRQLALANIRRPQLVFLLQPYLDSAISGIAHVGLLEDPQVTWTVGPLAPVVEGQVSGYPLTVRMQPSPLVVRAPVAQAPNISQNRALLSRAIVALNVTRDLPGFHEIEWLVTPLGEFYGLQCQPLIGRIGADG